MLTASFTPTVASAQQELGFLEEISAEQKTPEPDFPGEFSTWIRLAFKFERGKWASYGNRSMPEADIKPIAPGSHKGVKWIAVRQGKVIGDVISGAARSDGSLADFGLLPVQTNSPLQDLGPRVEEFGGWFGIPVKQPLVLLREPCERDREGWKPFPDAKVPAGAAAALRSADPDVFASHLPYPMTFTDADFKVFRAYKSRTGTILIALAFPDGSPFLEEGNTNGYPFWFVVARKTLRFVGGGMVPLDWADFDKDGQTDFVFKVSRYNEDGYALLCHGLTETVEFTWCYH